MVRRHIRNRKSSNKSVAMTAPKAIPPDKPLNILYYHPGATFGGAEISMAVMAESVPANAIYLQTGGKTPQYLRDRFKQIEAFQGVQSGGITETIQRCGIDLVVSFRYAREVSVVASMKKRPVIIRVIAHDGHLKDAAISPADGYITRGEHMLSELNGKHAVSILGGVDSDQFNPGIRQHRGHGEPFRVGFLGRITGQSKDLSILPDALDGLNVRLILAGKGGGKYARRREQLLDALDDRNISYELHAATDRPQDIIGRMDALLLPSTGEGWPRIVQEAMLMKVPCIVSHLPWVDSVRDKVAVAALKAHVFRQAVIHAMKDPEWFNCMAEDAYEWALQNCTTEVVAGQYREFVHEVVHGDQSVILRRDTGGGDILACIPALRELQKQGIKAEIVSNHGEFSELPGEILRRMSK